MKNLKKIFAVAMSIATVAMSTSAFAQAGVSKAKYADGVASLTVDATKDPTFEAKDQMTVVIVPKNLGEIKDTDIQYINQDEATGFTTILAGMGTKDVINPADYEVRVGGTNITDVWVFNFEDAVKILYGDADGDGAILTTDAILVLQHIADAAIAVKAGADTDGDGAILTTDAIAILQKIADDSIVLGPQA